MKEIKLIITKIKPFYIPLIISFVLLLPMCFLFKAEKKSSSLQKEMTASLENSKESIGVTPSKKKTDRNQKSDTEKLSSKPLNPSQLSQQGYAASEQESVYRRIKSAQVFLTIERDLFFKRNHIFYPHEDRLLYSITKKKSPQRETLNILGPHVMYSLALTVFPSSTINQALDHLLDSWNLMEDDLKKIKVKKLNSGFTHQSFYELPGSGRKYLIFMLGKNKVTKKTVMLSFQTSFYKRSLKDFILSKYYSIRIK